MHIAKLGQQDLEQKSRFTTRYTTIGPSKSYNASYKLESGGHRSGYELADIHTLAARLAASSS